MSVLRNKWFLMAVALAVINRIMLETGLIIPLVQSYLDDLLCFPILLSIGLLMYRIFWPNYRLTPWHIWPTVLLFSVYFEWYFPTVNSAFTADVLDVMMYGFGALAFDRLINRSVEHNAMTKSQAI